MNNLISKLKQQIILLICCFSFLTVSAQPQHLSTNAKISVLTCGTGDEMYALFGHTALRIKDTDNNLDVVYNWGMFDFRTPNFLSKFVKGNLLYYLDVDSFNDFLYNYKLDNREVVEQELNLSETERAKIWIEINRQLKSDDRYYTYGFIRNNCTTKVVDVINNAVAKPLSADFPSNNHSYRSILNEGLDRHYFEKLGINLLFGYATNKQSDIIFLPVKLLNGLVYNSHLLQSQKYLHAKEAVTNKTPLNSVYTLWAIVAFFCAGVMHKKVRFIYFLLTAVFSFFLGAVWIFSSHFELAFNVLILFYNPIIFLALFFKKKKMLNLGIAVSVFSLFLFGLELLKVVAPLVLLNLVFITVLFLLNNNLIIPLQTKK